MRTRSGGSGTSTQRWAALVGLGSVLLWLATPATVGAQITSEVILEASGIVFNSDSGFPGAPDRISASIEDSVIESYDNFFGPGTPPGIDVSVMTIGETVQVRFRFAPPSLADAPPGWAESLFAHVYPVPPDADLPVPADQVHSFILDATPINPEGFDSIVGYSFGDFEDRPSPRDVLDDLDALPPPPGIDVDARRSAYDEVISFLEDLSVLGGPDYPQPGFLVDGLLDGPLACGDHASHTVHCDPADPSGAQFIDGFDMFAMSIPGPLDGMGPPYETETPIVLLDPDAPVWLGNFEGDFFNGGNHAYGLRSTDGATPEFFHLQHNGSSWPPAPTASRFVCVPVAGGEMLALIHPTGPPTARNTVDGIDHYVPAGVRFNTFKGAVRAPGLVGSFSRPDPNAALLPTDDVPTIYPDLPGVTAFTVDPQVLFPIEVQVPDPAPSSPEPSSPAPTGANDPVVADPVEDGPVADRGDRPSAGPDPGDDVVLPPLTSSDGGVNTGGIVYIVIGGVMVAVGTGALLRSRREVAVADGPAPTPVEADLPDLGDALYGMFEELATDPEFAAKPPDEEWDALLLEEHRLQTLIDEDFGKVITALVEGYGAFIESIEEYHSHLAPVMEATESLDVAFTEGQTDLARAKIVDILWAIISLGKGAFGIGFKAYKWLKTPKSASGSAALVRAADELGVDLNQWMARFENAAEGASELIVAVARQRGWKEMPLWSEWVLKRILFNVRSAQAGRVAHIPFEDIEKLKEWAQIPGFWDDLAKAANSIRSSDGLVDDIALAFTKQDVDYLRAIAESGELTRILDDVPEALKTPGAMSGPVRMPITYFLDDTTAGLLRRQQQHAETLVPPYARNVMDSSVGTFLDGSVALRGSGASSVPPRGIDPEGITFVGDIGRRYDPSADTLLDASGSWQPAPPPGFNPNADTIIETWRGAYRGSTPPTWSSGVRWVDQGIPPTVGPGVLGPGIPPTLAPIPPTIPPGNLLNAPIPSTLPPIPPTVGPGVLGGSIPPTGWTGFPTRQNVFVPPPGFTEADTVATFRFVDDFSDVSVDLFATQSTLMTRGAGSVDEAAELAGALRTGPNGTVVLAGNGCGEVARRIDPSGMFTSSVLPDGSCLHGAEAVAAAGTPGTVVAVHGVDAAASALGGAHRRASPFVELFTEVKGGLSAEAPLLGEGLANRALWFVGQTENFISLFEDVGDEFDIVVGSYTDPGLGLVGYPTPYGLDPSMVVVDVGGAGGFDAMFDAAGLDPDLWMAGHADDAAQGADLLMGELGRRNGWHPIRDSDRRFFDTLIEDARRFAADGEPIDAGRMARLDTLVQQPDFFPWLMTATIPTGDGYLQPYNLEDVNLLQTLVLSGGDREDFQNRLGPVRVRVFRTLASEAAAASEPEPEEDEDPFAHLSPAQQAHLGSVISGYLNATATASMGLDHFLRSFGVVNNLQDDFKFWFFGTRAVESGTNIYGTDIDAAELLNGWWSFFSAPAETYTSWYWTAEAHDLFSELREEQKIPLHGLVMAANSSVNVLNGIQDALDVLDDPDSGIGSNTREALQGVLDGMQETFDSAPPDWQGDHRDQFYERMGHIRTKLINLETAVDALTEIREMLPQLIQWIDALRLDPSGGLRSGYQLIDPGFAARLGSAALALQALGNPGLLLSTASGDTSGGAPPLPRMTDEEFEVWEAELEARNDELNRALEEGNEPFDPSTLDDDPMFKDWGDTPR